MPKRDPDPHPLKIVRFEASNVKRLRAVEITPDGNLVVIAGRNGQGKSSILDAIMWVLGGGNTMKGTERPIRDGENRGEATVDLGEYVVTRTFTQGGGNLTVTTKDGAKVASPQALLDSMLGQHTFDPFAFTRMPAKAQRDALVQLVHLDIDLDANAEQRATVYQERTEIGRVRDRLKAQLDTMPPQPTDTPTEEVPASAVVAELREARALAEANRQARRLMLDAEGAVEEAGALVDRLTAELAAARTALAEADAQLVGARAVAEQVPPDPDIASIEQRLEGLDAVNRRVRAAQARIAVDRDWRANVDAYGEATAHIDRLDQAKADALARAAMPIEGLAFDDTGVQYAAGPDLPAVPLGQCSSSEQLRVSVAIAVAANPRIRVARVQEGSLLDSGSLRQLADLADEHQFMLWVEMVDESGKVGIVIEDGIVASVNPPFEAEGAQR